MVRRAHHKLKIYTKTGDKGKTSLYGGKRVSKADLRIEVIGEIDEFNSVIGVAITEVSSIKYQVLSIKEELLKIQKDLFEIDSVLAGSKSLIDLKSRVEELERSMDGLSGELPELRNFILPGGGETGSFLHFARAVCRRVERRLIQLSKKRKVDSSVLIYFNRLSDLLFTLARFVNFKEKKKEIIWVR